MVYYGLLNNIYPGGPKLIVEAKGIAAPLGKVDFEGISGWLSKWKKYYSVKRVSICCESNITERWRHNSYKTNY